MASGAIDLRALDRDVARAFRAWTIWRANVSADAVKHEDEDPIEPWRRVAGQSTYVELGSIDVSAIDAPLRDGLRRWICALTHARVLREIDVEARKAESEKSARYAVGPGREVSWRDAWRGVVVAETDVERRAWIDAAVERGPAIAAIARRRAERRAEASHRLGLESTDALAAPMPRADLESAALAFLAKTDDLARHVLREARTRRENDEPPHAAFAIALAVGRDAPEGWPARLQRAWLEDLFAPLVRGLKIDLGPLPAAVGGSSFARALGSFGFALRVAGASPSLPFSLARDPWFSSAHRFAHVFAALPASAPFQRRALGNVARVATHQARVFARTSLFEARLLAMRFLLTRDERFAPRDAFEELTARVLGAPLPKSLAGAWPSARDDEPARFFALLGARAFERTLVDRFDDDWFRSPHATLHLRALASAPARDDDAPLEIAPAIAQLTRAFEEALS